MKKIERIPDLTKNPEEISEYQEEELQDIWENDPGYVNEKAYRNLDDPKAGKYLETGIHSDGLMNYEIDAVENTEKEVLLSKGKIIERWGTEKGSYFTESGTDYEELHLIVSKDKLEHHTYEVQHPFYVTESVIAAQPFDETEDQHAAVQYKSKICVEDLIMLGFLKEEKKDEDR